VTVVDSRATGTRIQRPEFTGLGRYARITPARPTGLFALAEVDVLGTR
jgi:hypothetical protein